MPLFCPICMETLFTYNVDNIPDVYATPCGHVFHAFCLENWFEAKKNCPQCRKNIVSSSCTKLFLEVSNFSSSESDDILTLKAQIETMKFDLKLAATNTAKKEEHLKKGLSQIHKMRQRIVDKEKEVDKIKSQLLAVQEQNRVLHQKVVESKSTSQENEKLKSCLQRLVLIEDIMNSSSLSSDDLNKLPSEDCKKLSIYFKRALREERQEHESSESARITLSQENLRLKEERSTLRNEINLLKEVINSYKQSLDEYRKKSSLDTSFPATPESSFTSPKSERPLSDATTSQTSGLTGDDSESIPRFGTSNSFKRPMLTMSNKSPVLAKRFKVVSRRRKLL